MNVDELNAKREKILQLWRVGFGYTGENEHHWQNVNRCIHSSFPPSVHCLAMDDLRHASFAFRCDFAAEKRRPEGIEYVNKTVNDEAATCETVLQALTEVDRLGIEFSELADPLRTALVQYRRFLNDQYPSKRSPGRPTERALGTLMLTFAYLWKRYADKEAKGEEWKDFAGSALKASGYLPNYQGSDGDPGDLVKVLNTARKNCADEKLYLRHGEEAREDWILGAPPGWGINQGNN